MTETLISFEVAKLAKEKGYPQEGDIHYGFNGKINKSATQFIFNRTFNAPTQSILQKWIREKYNIHIAIYPIKDKWCGDIREVNEKANESFMDFENLKSYEEVLEKGLFYSLTLIENDK